jgi:demethylmenaquinone methyltransferase/2-methoxy-6-polyprenyl-1,4-benzoquinol methylase
MLEFGLPTGVPRPFWELYVRIGLPTGGRALASEWGTVGRFLGPSIRDFYARWPLRALVDLWGEVDVPDVRARRLSLGAGVVLWGTRA